MQTKPQKIIVGLSGGVDSAVAALRLKQEGHAVRALFMKNWEEDDHAGYCAAEQDLAAARAAAATLDIPLHTVNFSAEYWERVFAAFLAELKAGRTPNPDILCNREIKFHAFLEYALAQGAERIATGHYACAKHRACGVELRRAADKNKDQSYFLHQVRPAALSKTLFPLCRYSKPEVRAMARRAGLANHDRKDSTGICFIGERRFNEFVERYFPRQSGDIRALDGAVVGRHHGLMFHTIGQRKGLGIGGRKGGNGAPWFVAGKDLAQNTLWVAQGQDHPALYARGLLVASPRWFGAPPAEEWRCGVQTRHRQADQACRVRRLAGGRYEVIFDTPMFAVAPGQSAVFYDGDVCLGGGVIVSALAAQDGPARGAAVG